MPHDPPMPEIPATLLLARSPALPAIMGEAGEAGSNTIQIFPPGMQDATVSTRDGKLVPLRLAIDSAAADVLEAARAGHQAKAAAGDGDAPFFDFNHEDREASAWPIRIFWAGDDPLEGGIRAEVAWTAAGQAAVAGKTFRRFSPAFHADPKSGRITGAPVNMGGLVNRAAFRAIQPLFAKQAEDQTEKTIMNEPDPTDAQGAEITSLKEEIAQLRAELAGLKKAEAEAVVAAAAKDGRIPAAPEFQAKWVASILADPNAADLLASLPARPPEKTEFKAKAAETTPPESETPETLLAKFHELPREQKDAFFAAHSAEIIAAREAALRP